MKPAPFLLLALAACLRLSPVAAEEAPAPKQSYTLFHINTNAIAMTFDDGPHPVYTPKLLDILKERGIKATFFLIGKSVATHPEIVRRIVAEGHEVANHTWDHKMLRQLSQEKINDELQKTQDAIVAACGITPTVYRPPFGAITKKQQAAVMEKFHYPSIVWEVDTNDWKAPRTVAKVHDTILKDTHAGSIILCHDIHGETIDAMPATLDELKAKGFLFMTISQLIKLEGDEVKAVAAGKGLPATPATTTTPAAETKEAPKTEAKPAAK